MTFTPAFVHPIPHGFVISDTAFVLFGSPGHVVVVFGGQRISHRVQTFRPYYSLPAMSASSALIRIATLPTVRESAGSASCHACTGGECKTIGGVVLNGPADRFDLQASGILERMDLWTGRFLSSPIALASRARRHIQRFDGLGKLERD
ncbi:hypothetical protein BS47DRAFT_1394964 [Hydnum rufescens UP504]|uniref:Uncharacterized protein n=1 Tax=Hydnum rufescens UP504 TaxID=1448309 RepID=A0A9P6ATG0_9AGAM|nr:hypothetical protein BS47DRAFT_1394964 [Hydnum rufescens UP504]